MTTAPAQTPAEIGTGIVTACQALAANGCDTGIGGTSASARLARTPCGSTPSTAPLGEVGPDDVMKLDYKGNLLDGNRFVSPGWEFHAGIYGQRADVGSIVHTHSFWICALASMARPLKMRHNLCTLFYQDQVMSPDDDFESIGRSSRLLDRASSPGTGITVGTSLPRAAAPARDPRPDGPPRRHAGATGARSFPRRPACDAQAHRRGGRLPGADLGPHGAPGRADYRHRGI